MPAERSADESPYAGVDLLPDRERASDPWRQIIRDMTALAPMSHWSADVTSVRIKVYDQIRPFVTRAALLALTALLLGFAPGTWWLTWVLLLPALIQVFLEIVLDFELNTDEAERTPGLKVLAAIAEAAHTKTLVNATGVLGFIAVPCNIVAVAYFTGPGDPEWVKVLALAAAAAYGASGILSFLTDATHYSANQSFLPIYRRFRATRPHVWLIILVFMTLIVAGSIAMGRWAPTMAPLALALCVFPVVIGMKVRDYERFLRASSERLREVQDGAKTALTKDYHNANTEIRTFNRALAQDKSVPPAIRLRAAALAPLISLMGEAIDHEQWVAQQERPSLAGLAKKSASDASLNLTSDVRLDDLGSGNYDLARSLITALLVNVGQAWARINSDRVDADEQRLAPEVSLVGEIRDGQIHIVVRDPLPLITEWCREGSTTLWLHDDLKAHGGTGLSQHPVDPNDPEAGKEIRASWPVQKPPLRLRELKR